MSTRVAERLDDWDSRSFTGGLQELQELADADFSGVIRAGGAELYMTTGTVVGIERGSIDDFADAQGTVFVSPSPALPLLAVMQAEDVDVRAQYYSEDTPMSEVDRTLSDGAFTGYIELSENVLSGDYYVVYHGGERTAVGFVGNNARLITDEEAFETADDEVGIYKVRQVEIEPIEIAEAAGGTAGGEAETEADAAEAAAGGAGAAATSAEAGAEPTDQATDKAASESGGAAAAQEAESAAEGTAGAAAEGPTAADEDAGATERGEPDAAAEAEADTAAETAESTAESTTDQQAEPTRESTGAARDQAATEGAEPGGEPSTAAGGDTSTAEPEWQGSRSESESADAGDARTAEAAASESATERGRGGEQSAESSRSDRSSTGEASADQAQQSREGSGRGTEPARGGSGGAGASQRSTPDRQPAGRGGGAAGSGGSRARSGGSATDLETRSIPSLDPNLTKTPQRSTGRSAARDTPARGRQGSGGAAASQQGRSAGGAGRQQGRQPQAGGAEAASTESAGSAPEAAGAEAGGEREPTGGESGGVARERVDDLQSRLEEREAEVERLETELERVETEKDDLRDQLETARDERDDLAEQVERLESELRRLEEELGAATDAEQRITAREALDGTDVFVRYRSKGDATLQKAHDGSVRQKDVTGNLRLEKHTQFDAARVAVGGKSYHEFLEARPEYQFIRWMVEELLFEIRDTGHADALQVLYDALPKVDRGELNGVIDVTFTDEGQETRTQETFDVVLRDRMGNPLLVANLNDSRQGASESMMSDLITAAERVGQSADTFAGAFLVTRSFFEPDALETAEEATRSGIFSRDKRKSFVNISRKQGFHLCLVEARNQNFHLTVPEL